MNIIFAALYMLCLFYRIEVWRLPDKLSILQNNFAGAE